MAKMNWGKAKRRPIDLEEDEHHRVLHRAIKAAGIKPPRKRKLTKPQRFTDHQYEQAKARYDAIAKRRAAADQSEK